MIKISNKYILSLLFFGIFFNGFSQEENKRNNKISGNGGFIFEYGLTNYSGLKNDTLNSSLNNGFYSIGLLVRLQSKSRFFFNIKNCWGSATAQEKSLLYSSGVVTKKDQLAVMEGTLEFGYLLLAESQLKIPVSVGYSANRSRTYIDRYYSSFFQGYSMTYISQFITPSISCEFLTKEREWTNAYRCFGAQVSYLIPFSQKVVAYSLDLNNFPKIQTGGLRFSIYYRF